MATEPKNLRTGHPVWESYRARRIRYRRLTRDLHTDVLVVGSGITGAMIGETLASAGLKVTIVDRRPPGRGSTAASTALVQYEIDTPLLELSRKLGRDDAVRAWRRSRLAVTSLAARLQQLGVEMQRRDALYLAGNMLGIGELRREAKVRCAAGLFTRVLDRKELKGEYGIARAGALLGYDNIAVDPRAMTAAFLNAATERGADIRSPAEIVAVEPRRSGVTAETAEGHRIRARTLIFATGYEFPERVPRKGHRIVSTWSIATRPQKSRLWPTQCHIWEASDPYLYLRTTVDGRVICGGEDEDFSDEKMRDALLPAKTRKLVSKLHRLLPNIDPAPEFAWSASFGESSTSMPTISEVPRMPNCWVALGYGGNGITYSRIAAEIITSALTGETDPDADLYRFRR